MSGNKTEYPILEQEVFIQCERCRTFIISGTSTAKRIHNVKCLSQSMANSSSTIKIGNTSQICQEYAIRRFGVPTVKLKKLCAEEIARVRQQLESNVCRTRKSHLAAKEKLRKYNDGDDAECESETDDDEYELPSCKKIQKVGNRNMNATSDNENLTASNCASKKRRNRKRRILPPNTTVIGKNGRGERILRCELCSKTILEPSMQQHIEFHVKLEEKAKNSGFLCVICKNGFASAHSLRKHFVSSHMVTSPFKCRFSNCDFKAGDYYHLERHVRVHYNSDNVRCHKCGYSYSTYQTFLRHRCNAVIKGDDNTKLKRRKRNKKGFLRVKRISPTKNSGTDVKMMSTVDAIPLLSSDRSVKQEPTVHNIESISLIDKIIETDEGAIHVKGEHLEPHVETEVNYANSVGASNDSSPTVAFVSTIKKDPQENEIEDTSQVDITKNFAQKVILGWNNKLLSSSYLLSLIRKDSVFQKLEKEHPDFTKILLRGARHTDYKIESRNNITSYYRCEDCSSVFRRIWALEKHRKFNQCRHLAKTKSQNRNNRNPNVQENIFNDNTSVMSLLCVACGYKSASPEDLNIHIQSSPAHKNLQTNRNCQCPLCGAWFETTEKVNQHIDKIHNNKREFQCQQCKKEFASVLSLNKHKSFHCHAIDLGQQHICSKCIKTFKTLEDCQKHEIGCNINRYKYKPQCQQCGEKFSNNTALRRHVLVIHGNQPAPTPRSHLTNYKESLEQVAKLTNATDNGKNNENEDELMIVGF